MTIDITYIEINEDGSVLIKGKCKASDFHSRRVSPNDFLDLGDLEREGSRE